VLVKMSRPSPLLISSGSVHHRQAHTFYDDEADADLVDASLPATPVAERHFPGTYNLGESDDDADRAEEESKEGEHVKEEEWVKDEPEPTPLRELDPDEVDERQCRICFGGVDDEDTLGRLISPCLCAGSMRVSPLYFRLSQG